VADASRVALVHDFLLDLRGAERTFLAICDLWPEADVYTAVYDERGTEGRFSQRGVQASFLQRLRPTARTFRALLPFYPTAIESLDLSGYDLVVSSSSAWSHGVICGESATHLCYCHNPFRYAWNDRERVLSEHRNPLVRAALRRVFHRWRQWDWIAAQRVDRYVANSRATQRRIRAYFGRDSSIVHPPVDTARFTPGEVSDHYLVLSELMPHKRIDEAVQAFNRLRRPLMVVGDGPDARRLQRLAASNVRFTGRVEDGEVERLLSSCRALIVPSVEEFGIAAVEAQAAGRPVIARREGGTCETVVEATTGAFWDGGVDELVAAVEGFDDSSIDPADCTANAERFSIERFHTALAREASSGLHGGDDHERRAARSGARVRGLAIGRRRA
jgi:glycosyltransferase involved in cell wall biosynthesis